MSKLYLVVLNGMPHGVLDKEALEVFIEQRNISVFDDIVKMKEKDIEKLLEYEDFGSYYFYIEDDVIMFPHEDTWFYDALDETVKQCFNTVKDLLEMTDYIKFDSVEDEHLVKDLLIFMMGSYYEASETESTDTLANIINLYESRLRYLISNGYHARKDP